MKYLEIYNGNTHLVNIENLRYSINKEEDTRLTCSPQYPDIYRVYIHFDNEKPFLIFEDCTYDKCYKFLSLFITLLESSAIDGLIIDLIKFLPIVEEGLK